MSRDATKRLGGWIVVMGHLIVLSWVVLEGNLSPEQRRTIAWTLTPVLTIYFVALVKSIRSDGDAIEARTAADSTVVLTSVLLPSLLMLIALYLMASYPSSLADTSDSLQQWIAGIEVALAVTVGWIVDDLVPVTRDFKAGRVNDRPVTSATQHTVAGGGEARPAKARY